MCVYIQGVTIVMCNKVRCAEYILLVINSEVLWCDAL
jgi:hypothetical protein